MLSALFDGPKAHTLDACNSFAQRLHVCAQARGARAGARGRDHEAGREAAAARRARRAVRGARAHDEARGPRGGAALRRADCAQRHVGLRATGGAAARRAAGPAGKAACERGGGAADEAARQAGRGAARADDRGPGARAPAARPALGAPAHHGPAAASAQGDRRRHLQGVQGTQTFRRPKPRTARPPPSACSAFSPALALSGGRLPPCPSPALPALTAGRRAVHTVSQAQNTPWRRERELRKAKERLEKAQAAQAELERSLASKEAQCNELQREVLQDILVSRAGPVRNRTEAPMV
eukprot:7053177-Prymnesium_polylepis.1